MLNDVDAFNHAQASGNNDVAFSWSSSALPYDGTGETCPSGGKFTSVGRSRSKLNSSMSSAMTPGENADTALASCANATFTRLAAQRESGADTRPFFFAVGFHKPHIRESNPANLVKKVRTELTPLLACKPGPCPFNGTTCTRWTKSNLQRIGFHLKEFQTWP